MRRSGSPARDCPSLLAFSLACLLVVIQACGTDSNDHHEPGDAASESEPSDTTPAGRCPQDRRLGGFEVRVLDDISSVYGSVSDGVLPASVLVEIQAEGDCRLLRAPNPFCDPPCDRGEVCNLEENCVAQPELQDVGTVTITGLEQEVVMSPVQPGNTYFDATLPHPAFEEGQPIRLVTTDGFLGVLELQAVGPAALELPSEVWTVARDQALSVSWNAPPTDHQSQILLTLSIDRHGISPARLECEFPDTGHAEIPASLINALVDSGMSGVPSGELTRLSADSVDTELGCVELLVTLPRTVEVEVVSPDSP